MSQGVIGWVLEPEWRLGIQMGGSMAVQTISSVPVSNIAGRVGNVNGVEGRTVRYSVRA
jgi:hypothetical protein